MHSRYLLLTHIRPRPQRRFRCKLVTFHNAATFLWICVHTPEGCFEWYSHYLHYITLDIARHTRKSEIYEYLQRMIWETREISRVRWWCYKSLCCRTWWSWGSRASWAATSARRTSGWSRGWRTRSTTPWVTPAAGPAPGSSGTPPPATTPPPRPPGTPPPPRARPRPPPRPPRRNWTSSGPRPTRNPAPVSPVCSIYYPLPSVDSIYCSQYLHTSPPRGDDLRRVPARRQEPGVL